VRRIDAYTMASMPRQARASKCEFQRIIVPRRPPSDCVQSVLPMVGGYLKESRAQSGALEFESVIPAFYKIFAREGTVSSVLDGEGYSSKHFFKPSTHTQGLVFVWAGAVAYF